MISKKTVLITGCSDGGIGCALAHAFHSRGFHVFASARDPAKMASLSGKSDVTLVTLDVVNDEQVAAASAMVQNATGGKLDYLVNNAARNHFMPMMDESIEKVQQLFDTNVFGPLRMIKAFTPMIIETKGAVVDITSISGHINMPWMGSYGAAKRSMEIMAETLRLELKPFGVRVLSIVTGPVDTNGLTYFDDFELPATSMYKAIEPIIKGRANGAGRPAKCDTPDEYAAKVIESVLGKRSGLVWAPGMTVRFVKFATSWLSTWMTVSDAMWMSGTGLAELSDHERKKTT